MPPQNPRGKALSRLACEVCAFLAGLTVGPLLPAPVALTVHVRAAPMVSPFDDADLAEDGPPTVHREHTRLDLVVTTASASNGRSMFIPIPGEYVIVHHWAEPPDRAG